MKRAPVRAVAAVATAALTVGLFQPAALAGTTAPDRPSTMATTTDDAEVVPVRETGPANARFNLVFLADGYTADEMDRFRTHLDRHVNVLLSLEPFKAYRGYLNIYAVEIPSPESGVDCDPGPDDPRRDTPLNMGFWGGCDPDSVQRLLGVDGDAAERYADLVTGTSPRNRQIVAMANSDTYGGAGGRHATASGGNALSALITPHEIGHSLGNLQDEYDYYQRGVPGGAYDGQEPDSIHHTTLTEKQLRKQRAKWWRWLGEPSLAGGRIGRYEGGLYHEEDVWRPSEHSMMKSLGYAFDQPSRERMTERISGRTSLIQDATGNDDPVGADRVLWVEPMHPTDHQLDVTWSVNGRELPTSERSLDLAELPLRPGNHTVDVEVSDPTEFVRDPEIRDALTERRTWTVDTSIDTPEQPVPDEFTASTSTDRPVGRNDVVYVETTHPTDRVADVRWSIDGRPIPNPRNDRELDLSRLPSKPGGAELSARVGSDELTWSVDTTPPRTSFELSEPARVNRKGEYVFDGPFTMKLTGTDDTDGYVVSEFRVDGDGWHTYYGWPTDPDEPFRFSARGTNVDDLIYGNLGSGGLSVSPFAEREPGYGRHVVEYRSVDAAGNVAKAERVVVRLLPPEDR